MATRRPTKGWNGRGELVCPAFAGQSLESRLAAQPSVLRAYGDSGMTALTSYPLRESDWRARLRTARKENNLLGVACIYEDMALARRQEGAVAASRRAFRAAAEAWRQGRSMMRRSRWGTETYDLVWPDSLRREAWCLAEVGSFAEARRLLTRVNRCRKGQLFAEEIQLLVKSFPELA